jgi:hypothetical protein
MIGTNKKECHVRGKYKHKHFHTREGISRVKFVALYQFYQKFSLDMHMMSLRTI